MIFESEKFYADLVENIDLNEILEVYNSNHQFVINHMNSHKVSTEWILQEVESMRKIGFASCKIIDTSLGKIIGIIDFKVSDETYLSLLMLHNDYKGKGYGKLIFKTFEEYAKSLKSKSIRIDVVTNYDNSVLDFWIDNGFIKIKDMDLNWTGKILPAVMMKKNL